MLTMHYCGTLAVVKTLLADGLPLVTWTYLKVLTVIDFTWWQQSKFAILLLFKVC